MNDDTLPSCTEENEAQYTAPEKFTLTASGFASEEEAKSLLGIVGSAVRLISGALDLSGLDGVTIAYDYNDALSSIERGFPSNHALTPSNGDVVGIAMTPLVLRDGVLKSHIVFNARYIVHLGDENNENFGFALHTLAHECAHVEVTQLFENCFPSRLLPNYPSSSTAKIRSDIILACWDEYAATYRSAPIGAEPTAGYEDNFLHHVRETKARVTECISEYRLHGRPMEVLIAVLRIIGNLMKFSAYHLGNLDGLKIAPENMPRTAAILEGHWFAPFFIRIHEALRDIRTDYGAWQDDRAFEVIADLADEILQFVGITYKEGPASCFHIEVEDSAFISGAV
jgi:hypothetical protein